MKGHDLIGSTHPFTTNEHCWHRGVAPKPGQGLLNFTPSRHFIQLVDGRVNSKVREKGLDGVAHAAWALAEYHHWPLWCQPCHCPLHCTTYFQSKKMCQGMCKMEGRVGNWEAMDQQDWREKIWGECEPCRVVVETLAVGICLWSFRSKWKLFIVNGEDTSGISILTNKNLSMWRMKKKTKKENVLIDISVYFQISWSLLGMQWTIRRTIWNKSCTSTILCIRKWRRVDGTATHSLVSVTFFFFPLSKFLLFFHQNYSTFLLSACISSNSMTQKPKDMQPN